MKVDTRFYNNGRFNEDRNIECARYKNLVYARTLKCGSEFFWKNFTITAGWEPVKWSDIDWSKDTVFSYIMDPIQRRHKGIAEYLFINQALDLLKDPAFCRIIAQAPFLDEHSASMRNIYGDKVDQIEWIPMSQTDHGLSQRLTDQLLEGHNHPLIEWNPEFVHTTENYIGSVYRQLRDLWDAESFIGLVRFYFQEDVGIYQSALQKHGIAIE